jgi:hypothetical protein
MMRRVVLDDEKVTGGGGRFRHSPMRTVSWLGLVLFLCFGGSACGAKVVVDTPGEGGEGGSSSSGPSSCTPGEVEPCYSGPAGVIGVGVCASGIRICSANGTLAPCQGEILPSAEICGNFLDEDCNGIADDPSSCDGPCVGCADYVTVPPDPSVVLCSSSQPVYDAFFSCLCAGACAVSCSANFCVGSEPGQSCADCAVQSPDGCGNELIACSNDF